MWICRRHVTLIEVLIVMMIIALVSGIIGINISKSLKEQRFRMEVSQMVDTLRLAQDLMLVMGADVHVRVKALENNKGAEYWLDVEGGVPPQWDSIIKGVRHTFKEVHGIFFRDLQPFPLTPQQLDIRFESGGSMMSKGIMRLSDVDRENVEGARVMAICLKGYPHPITSVSEEGKPIECEDPEDTAQNDRLTSLTVREILEDEELVKSAEADAKAKKSLPGTPSTDKNEPSDEDENS